MYSSFFMNDNFFKKYEIVRNMLKDKDEISTIFKIQVLLKNEALKWFFNQKIENCSNEKVNSTLKG